MIGQMFKTVGARMPAPPSYASPPPLWGDEAHVRELLEPLGLEVSCERTDAVMRGDSVEAIVKRMEDNFGPWKMAQAALGDDWPSLRAELFDLYAGAATESEGGVSAFAEYLVVVARKPAG
jgi:hypothetical protein